MPDIKEALNQLKEINGRYDLQDKPIIEYLEGMDKELVCVPVIGPFSSGKTAVINALLGYRRKILVQDITPETAIPTEIQYRFEQQNGETARITYSDGHEDSMGLEEYLEKARDQLDAASTVSVRLCLDNSFFGSISRVLLVDMPGFGSGEDIHDKAINNYAANSMAYIIAFPADHLVMHDQVGGILKELCVMDKPVCALITKTDKAPPEADYKAAWKKLDENLAKYLGGREIEWLETSSRDGEVKQLGKYLRGLQEKSEHLLLTQKFFPFLNGRARDTLAYLKTRLDKSGLSEPQLKEQEENLDAEMRRLTAKTAELSQEFRKDTENCVQDIVNDVRMALHGELDSYVSMIMNRADEGQIAESMNATVRAAVNGSVQQRFVAKARKYMENVSAEVAAMDTFNAVVGVPGEGQMNAGFDAAAGVLGGAAAGAAAAAALGGGGAAAVGGGALGFAATAVPTIAVSIPVVGIALVIAGVVGGIIAKLLGSKKREEAKAKLRRQLILEVFPSVLQQLLPCVQKELTRKTDEICSQVQQKLQERKAALEKALTDCRAELADEAEKNSRAADEMRCDIAAIENMLITMKESCLAI